MGGRRNNKHRHKKKGGATRAEYSAHSLCAFYIHSLMYRTVYSIHPIVALNYLLLDSCMVIYPQFMVCLAQEYFNTKSLFVNHAKAAKTDPFLVPRGVDQPSQPTTTELPAFLLHI